ncbi:MAG: UDP-2,3-diacylglucosamine diphosphatase LpxI [Deltaproteobacteria bacterium]|nr:UDP-2,3-diacylglucosamine diphosphatase LpxI [Deltaproteobacteria bacterium]
MTDDQPVGLIAGNRQLPLIAARAVKKRGGSLAVCGISGETESELRKLADHHTELPLGQLKPIADFFLQAGVKTLAMAGGVSRANILENYRPDEAAVKLMESLSDFQTDTILRALAGYLESRGLALISVSELAPELMARPGQMGAHSPAPELEADLALAFKVAKELGRLGVGQTVVVSDKICVALEGADGTDPTILRGAALSKRPVAVAKVVKPGQDTRFDLPVVGPPTLELLTRVKAGGLVLDAGGVLILDEPRCVEIADQGGLALLGWREAPAPKREEEGA